MTRKSSPAVNRSRWLVALSLIFLVATCAAMPEKLQKMIEQGKYDKAVEAGEKYLEKKPDAEDAAAVKSLVMEADYRWAVQLNTLEDYEAFEKKYPKSSYQKDVTERKSVVYYNTVTVKGGTLEDYLDFLKKYPKSSLCPEARQKVYDLAWERAKFGNTVEAYHQYRVNYPKSNHAAEAYQAEADRAFEAAKKVNTVESYKKFRQTYANTEHSQEAYQKESELVWDKARNGRREDVVAFLRDYPDSPHAPEAEARTEQLTWEEANQKNQCEAYANFFEAYPNSAHRKEAESKTAALCPFEAAPGLDEFTTRVITVDDRDPNGIRASVQVMGPDGEPVGGLLRDHFLLYENGCPAPLLDFRGLESERPVDIVFILDLSGSMTDKIAALQSQIVKFVDTLKFRGRDARLGLVAFSNEIVGVFPKDGNLSRDLAGFSAAIGQLPPAVGGVEAGPEALMAASRMKFRPRTQVIFILVTDEPIFQAGQKAGTDLPQVSQVLRDQRISLAAIAPEEPSSHELIARVGGDYYDVKLYSAKFAELIETLAETIGRQYELVYRATACASAGVERQARVRARRSYIYTRTAQVPVKDVAGLAIDPARGEVSYLAAGEGGMWRSLDRGLTWSALGQDLGETAFEMILITAKSGGKLLALSRAGKIYLSSDNGETWVSAAGAPNVIALVQDPSEPSVLYAADGQFLYATGDGGQTWSKRAALGDPAAPLSLSFDVSTGGRLFALGPGPLLRMSLDGGKTFQEFKTTLPDPNWDLAKARLYSHPYWLGFLFLIGPDGKLYRSMDSGTSWEIITPPSAAKAGLTGRGLVFDPSRRHWLILPTSEGVFASHDNGLSWFALGLGIEPADRVLPVAAVDGDGRLEIAGRNSGNVYRIAPVLEREFLASPDSFKTGSADLSPGFQTFLDDVAARLSGHPEAALRIEGHTDEAGSDSKNLDLSLKRAQAVRDYLINKGANPDRIIAAGYGKSRPLFPNPNAENRGRNRRVELIMIGQSEPLPKYR